MKSGLRNGQLIKWKDDQQQFQIQKVANNTDISN
jgi:hypothetical protein